MTSLEAPGPTRLGPESNGLLMKPEEFIAIEEWDRAYRYELVNGVVIVNAAPGPGERSPNDTLGFWLRLYQQNDPQGKVIDDTLPEQYIQTFRGWRRMDRAVWIGPCGSDWGGRLKSKSTFPRSRSNSFRDGCGTVAATMSTTARNTLRLA